MAGLAQLACIKDFEEKAEKNMPDGLLQYFKAGAGQGHSLTFCQEAFLRVRLKPRVLRNVSNRSMSTKVLERFSSLPFGIAPTASHKLAHPLGEVATALAAQEKGAVFILSMASSCSIEKVAASAPRARKWIQLCIFKDRAVTENLIKRSEAAGFEALVLTVDRPVLGIRNIKVNLTTSLPNMELSNFKNFRRIPGGDTIEDIQDYVGSLFDESLTWEDVNWLKKNSTLPIILKGILAPKDAKLAAECGVAGIIVSSHGARQLDTAVTPLEVLPAIVKTLKGTNCEVYVDGAISTGSDVFKALAIGAKMVFLGRAPIWGLACGGQKGVEKVLEILANELDNTMALCGVTSIKEINSNYITTPPEWNIHNE